VSEVAEPARLSGEEPSPQSTLIDVTVPSWSVQLKLAVTVCPVVAGFGDMLLMLHVGGTSAGVVTVIGVVAWPVELLLSVAVTVIVKVGLEAVEYV